MPKKGLFSMNILLVNNDAVVTKLVKLSTQKTGDRLDVATSLDEIRDENYDLLILDGSLFDRDFLEALNDKVLYAHSIFITTRESGETDLFEKHLFKPFLPTELLFLLHQFATVVSKENEALSKEIVFDDFDASLFEEDEVESGSDTQVREQSFKNVDALEETTTEERREEEVLDNIFSEQEVSEVKAILDALNDDPEQDKIVEEVLSEEEPKQDIDLELEQALQNFSRDDLAMDLGTFTEEDESVEEETSWDEPKERTTPSKQNQESIETLRTLLQALENPQIAKSLRGTITINLTFGED